MFANRLELREVIIIMLYESCSTSSDFDIMYIFISKQHRSIKHLSFSVKFEITFVKDAFPRGIYHRDEKYDIHLKERGEI